MHPWLASHRRQRAVGLQAVAGALRLAPIAMLVMLSEGCAQTRRP